MFSSCYLSRYQFRTTKNENAFVRGCVLFVEMMSADYIENKGIFRHVSRDHEMIHPMLCRMVKENDFVNGGAVLDMNVKNIYLNIMGRLRDPQRLAHTERMFMTSINLGIGQLDLLKTVSQRKECFAHLINTSGYQRYRDIFIKLIEELK